MQKDFNKIFWNIWGISQRVYTYEDIFRIKNSSRESSKKNLNKFLNNKSMRDESFMELLYKDLHNFYLVFKNLFYKVGNDKSLELIKELNNISFTYRFLDLLNVNDKDLIINLFSFQVAYILENISYLKIDTSLFENALKENSFKTYLDYYEKKSNKNQSGIANDLHNTFCDLMSAIEENYTSTIKKIDSEKVFLNDISKWKNAELPEFLKIITLNVAIFFNKEKQEKRANLIMMLMLRALIHIKREYEIDTELENIFLTKLNDFRIVIREKLIAKDYTNLYLLKSKYCIDFEKMIEESENTNIDINILMKYMSPYMKNVSNINIEKDLETKIIKYYSKFIKWHY